MRMFSRVSSVVVAAVVASLAMGCTDSRREQLEREAADRNAGKVDAKGEPVPDVPPHPTREALRPVLAQIFNTNERLPDVVEVDSLGTEDGLPYAVTPGVLATVKIKKGLPAAEKIQAIVMGTAEADSWAFRKNSRRDYADLIQKLKYSYGEDTKNKVLRAYAKLRLIAYFNSPDAAKAIGQLPADVQSAVEAMKTDYVDNRDKYWQAWMDVKMYARRTVGHDEPFRSVLRQISRDLGQEEMPPRSFTDSVDPPFKEWVTQITADEPLLIMLTNMKELKDRVEFLGETHTIWAIQGSELIPEKAQGVTIDKATGYGFFREDLGGGYNDLTFVFSPKLSGSALKQAFIHSMLFRQLLTDYQLLATAGGDFSKRGEDGSYDANTAIVPDKYDPLYAQCGATAALDTMLANYGTTYALLAGLTSKNKDSDKALTVAHKCVLAGAGSDIKVPDKDDEFDTQGPAPLTRRAFFQMLARFERFDVDTAALAGDKRMAEDDEIDEQEKLLKQLRAQAAAKKDED